MSTKLTPEDLKKHTPSLLELVCANRVAAIAVGLILLDGERKKTPSYAAAPTVSSDSPPN